MKNHNIIVVKVGTNTLIDANNHIRHEVIRNILAAASQVSKTDKRVVVVTSGATKLGRIIGQDQTLSTAIAASLGQPVLFASYAQEAEVIGITLAEFLITRPTLVRREQFLRLQNTFEELFAKQVVPVVNENDALTAGTDWSFGDNDSLAAALAIAFKAEQLIILSHIEGLFDSDPDKNPNARLIEQVDDINSELLKVSATAVSTGGRGGMLSKLKAARICTAIGIKTRVVNGLVLENLARVLQGEQVGTTFIPRAAEHILSNRERWLLAAKNSDGSVEIDNGAVTALKSGKSLLAVGVRRVYGQFETKEIIEVVDEQRRGIAFGIVDYAKSEIENMLSLQGTAGKQLIHANNMIVLK